MGTHIQRQALWGSIVPFGGATVLAGITQGFSDVTVPFNWWIVLILVGGAVTTLAIVNVIRAHFSPAGQFDVLGGWSLSVRPGNPAVAARNGKLDRYLLQMSQFYNLSATQSREINLELYLPYYDSERGAARLTRTHTEELEYEDVWKDQNPRYAENLILPITVPANGKREGRIEFEVPAGIIVNEIDWSSPVVVVTETRSGRSITILPDHVYDGRSGRQYRGGLHNPFPKEAQREMQRLKALTAHISRD